MVVAALLFAASAAATVLGCLAMSDIGEMPMHGGWTLSMAWAPMCGQTWAGAAASFVGAVVFVLGAALAQAVVQMPALARSVPTSSGMVMLLAGAFQFTAWKAQHLACCRQTADPGSTVALDAAAAWRHGVQLGLHCCRACGGLTAILLVLCVMDLRAMAIVTVATTAERWAAGGERLARWVGALAVAAGLVMMARAL